MNYFDSLTSVPRLLGAALLAACMMAPGSAFAQQSSISVSVESQQADPGDAPNVPVNVENFDDVGSFSIVFRFDDSKLSLPSSDLIKGEPRDFIVNRQQDGDLVVAFFQGSGESKINFGSGTLFDINFSNFAGGRAEIEIVSNETEVNGSSVTTRGGFVSEQAGTLSLADLTDVPLNSTARVSLTGQGFPNANQGSSGPDVGQFAVEIDYPEQALQFESVANNQTGVADENLIVNDQNGVLRIEAADADVDGNIDLNGDLLDLEFTFLGGSPPDGQIDLPVLEDNSAVRNLQAQELVVSYQPGSVQGDAPAVRLPDQAVDVGTEVKVPLMAEDLRDVGQADIDVEFNDGALSFKRAEDVIGADFSVGKVGGQTVRFSGFSTGGVNPANNKDRLATLVFQVESGINTLGGETTLDFTGTPRVSNPTGTSYNMTFDGGRLVVEDPKIGVDPTSVDFGTITVGNTGTGTVTVTNEATEVAELSGTVQSLPSGSPFTITSGQGSFTLGPKESLDVTIEYAPSTASSGNPQTETLSITHNGENEPSPFDVSLEGVANAPPSVETASSVTVTVSEQVTITDNELRTTDPEDGPADLTYTVTTAPTQGQILVAGSQSSKFTQAQVNAGDVVYNHTASDATDDSFGFEVSDSDGGTASGTLNVTVEESEGVLSGTLTYPVEESETLGTGRALGGVAVEAENSQTFSSPTESDGSYQVEVEPGTYTVGASRQSLRDDIGGAGQNVSTLDAQRIVLGSVGKVPFVDPFQRRLGDVTDNGTTNAIDALQVARFSIGEINSFAAGDWARTTQQASVQKGQEKSGLQINAAEYGDVNLDGGETSGGNAAKLATAPAAGAKRAPVKQAKSGTIAVPVRLARGAKVGAFELTIGFDSEKLSFEGASTARGKVLSNAGDGTVQVAWLDETGTKPLRLGGGDRLVTLTFAAESGAEKGPVSLEVKGGLISDPLAQPLGVAVTLPDLTLGERPEEFTLKGASPNPTSGQTRLKMDLPSEAAVTVEVYNALGQRVLRADQEMAAGAGQSLQLQGGDLPSGQYFYRVEARMGEQTIRKTGRMTIVE